MHKTESWKFRADALVGNHPTVVVPSSVPLLQFSSAYVSNVPIYKRFQESNSIAYGVHTSGDDVDDVTGA